MRKLLLAVALAASTMTMTPAYADQAPVYTGLLSRVAVSGYDPVAYFTDGRPVRGSEQFRINHRGYEYRFASAEHLAAFRANPTRYAPQYGGYWRIVDGKLYLNYNDEVQSRWEQDIPGHIRSANSNWPSVLSR
jgi:YHS domain-containing protein